MQKKFDKYSDPDLPSYCGETYTRLGFYWKLVGDVYDFDRVWMPGQKSTQEIKRYLPQEAEEPADAYQARLTQSYYQFDDRYRRAVNQFAALLSNIHTDSDLPETLQARLNNIDLKGTKLSTFIQESTETALNQGGIFWLVEKLPIPIDADGNSLIQTAADEQKYDRAPYLVAFSPDQVLNWVFEVIDGVKILTQITLLQRIDTSNGRYGTATEEQYLVLTPGYYEIYQVVEDRQTHKATAILIQEGLVTDYRGTPLKQIPIVYYSATEMAEFDSMPPLLALAKLNIHLFQLESDRFNVLHRCNLPTPVIEDDIRVDPATGQALNKKVVIGPNSVLRVSKGGKAYFIEPAGTALSATKEKCDDVKRDMDQVTLSFLSGSQVQKTATEIVFEGAQMEASLQGLARLMNSALQKILQLWVAFTGEPLAGVLETNSDIFKQPFTPQQAQVIVALLDSGRLTYETAMNELQRGKVLNEEIDFAEEERKLGFVATRPDEKFDAEPFSATDRNASSRNGSATNR